MHSTFIILFHLVYHFLSSNIVIYQLWATQVTLLSKFQSRCNETRRPNYTKKPQLFVLTSVSGDGSVERIFGKTCKKCSETVESSEGGGWAGGGGGGHWGGRGADNCGVTNKYWAPAPHPHTPALSFINSRPKNRLITMDLRNIIHNGGNVVTNYF